MSDIPSRLSAALADRYLLERELGRGGMATVYLTRDLKHDRLVALKVLRPELAQALGPERFLREIRTTARLQHPHILPVLDSGEAAAQLWYTMPYVRGESLRERLRREAQLPVDVAVDLARQVALALDYAHREGVIHRDLKPENILLSEGQALVADFGVAKALAAGKEGQLTETGMSVGTPTYMSPEQASAGQVDGRTDIYALGCVLYEMLAGEPPFTGPTPQAILAKRLLEPVPHVRALRDVPESIEWAVTKALGRSPADRFTDAAGFAAALLAARGSRPMTRAELDPRRTFNRRIAVFAAAALGISSLALGLYRRVYDRPADALDPNVLAVAPFDILDSSLQLWREGLVDILSRDLDGAGPLRTISQSIALKGWSGRADRTSAAALGARTGAGLVVFGSMGRKGADSVSLRASVLDRSSSEVERDLEVTGEERRIGELADSLGVEILRALGRNRPVGSVRRISLASRSLPALKKFLRGEQFYRSGLWDSALVYYDLAITQDSTFALALWRMGLVLGWSPASSAAYRPGEEYARRSFLLNHGLAPRESLLIAAISLAETANEATTAADFIGSLSRSIATNQEAVRRYPQDPEAWYLLGEAKFHLLPPFGGRPAPALDAFEHAIALDSGFAPAYEHAGGLAIDLGRPELARQYASAYLRLDPTNLNAPSIRLAALMMDPETASAPETVRLIDTASISTLFSAGIEHLGSWTDSGETAIRLLRSISERKRSAGGSAPWVLDSLMWPQYVAHALAFRGHLREAFEIDRRLLLDPKASRFSGFLDPFLSLSLLDIVPDSLAGVTFSRSLKPGASWEWYFTPRQLRGLPWWLARRDTASLARFTDQAARVSRRPGTPVAALRTRLLGSTAAAYLALARGDSAAALRKLEAIPDTLCLAFNFPGDCFHPNLTRARLLAARGEYRRAGEVLDRWRWEASRDPFFVIATLELARMAERSGEREEAVDCYRFVVDVWRSADPELQPYVTESRQALGRLRRD